jgi:hypothetical protein
LPCLEGSLSLVASFHFAVSTFNRDQGNPATAELCIDV